MSPIRTTGRFLLRDVDSRKTILVCVLHNLFASLSFVMKQRCSLSCCTSRLKAEGQLREAAEEDLVGESSFVVDRRRILDAELFAARHASGCFGFLARLS